MRKTFTYLIAVLPMATMFTSCKKTEVDTLTGHKWVLSSATQTYSDSGTVSHNLLFSTSTCTSSSYTQFSNANAKNELKLMYTYTTTNCPGQVMSPDLAVRSWDIDPDMKNIYLGGNTTSGDGGQWFVITSTTSTGMTLTQTGQDVIGNTGPPDFGPIYHTVTSTFNWTIQDK